MKKKNLFLKKSMLFIFLAPLLSATLLGCFPKTERSMELGPEVSPDQVSTAINDGIDPLDPLTLKVGDFSHVVHSIRVDTASGRQERITKEEGRNITNREETSSELKFTLVNEVVEYNGDDTTKVTLQSEAVFPKSARFPTMVAAEKLFTAAENLSATEVGSKLDSPDPVSPSAVVRAMSGHRVTYHNLRVSTFQIAPPDSVKARAGCGGMSTCSIRVRQVQFDQVEYPANGDFKKTRYSFKYSPDIPALEPYLEKCSSGVGAVEKTHVVFEQCTRVVDFRFGP